MVLQNNLFHLKTFVINNTYSIYYNIIPTSIVFKSIQTFIRNKKKKTVYYYFNL